MTVVLLLHAFPFDARMWDAQVPVLEQAGYEVLAPNLPGRDPDSELGSWAERLLELAPGEFVPVGVSMGGYLIFELWRRARQRIPALVLADTRADADAEAARAGRAETIGRLEAGFDGFWADLEPKMFATGSPPEAVARARQIASEQAVQNLVATVEALRDRPDSTETLGQIDVPALVVVGQDDPMTPPASAGEMAAALARGRLAVVPRAGHLTPLERPKEFNEELLLFLHEAFS
jgi:pimeloyl-ACP methyl ester carboxylesterase